MNRRRWTESEITLLRRHYRATCKRDLAILFERPIGQVYQAAARYGLCQDCRADTGPAFIAFLRDKHAAGWSDAEIAQAWGCERHTVGDHRSRFRLPHNAYSAHRRQRVAARTREQCQQAGLPSLGAVRAASFRRRALNAGWPADLRPRAVQMLNVLAERGPMTRLELAQAIGMPWKGSRKSLVSNDPEGSYLAHLIARGLVISLGRIATGKGRGKSRQVYSLNLWVERGKVA